MISGSRGLSMWVLFSSNQPCNGILVPMFRRTILLPSSKLFRQSMTIIDWSYLLHMSCLGKYVFLQDIWLLSRERTSVCIHCTGCWVGPWPSLYILYKEEICCPCRYSNLGSPNPYLSHWYFIWKTSVGGDVFRRINRGISNHREMLPMMTDIFLPTDK